MKKPVLKRKPVPKAEKPKRESPAERAGTWIHEFCTMADLSKILHLSMRKLADLKATGVLVQGEKNGTFRTIPSINSYIDQLRATAAGRSSEQVSQINVERQTIVTIERKMAAIKLAQLEGEVLLLSEVSESWSTFASKVKAAMMTVPTKSRARIPHLTSHDQETIRIMIVDILKDLAKEVEASVIAAEAKHVKP